VYCLRRWRFLIEIRSSLLSIMFTNKCHFRHSIKFAKKR